MTEERKPGRPKKPVLWSTENNFRMTDLMAAQRKIDENSAKAGNAHKRISRPRNPSQLPNLTK